jgi:hypothetical protein
MLAVGLADRGKSSNAWTEFSRYSIISEPIGFDIFF